MPLVDFGFEGFQGPDFALCEGPELPRLRQARERARRKLPLHATVKPGAYPDGDDSPRPPHIHLNITGKTDRVVTQMLFPGEPLNETDDVVSQWARARLTANPLGHGPDGALRFRWDMILDTG